MSVIEKHCFQKRSQQGGSRVYAPLTAKKNVKNLGKEREISGKKEGKSEKEIREIRGRIVEKRKKSGKDENREGYFTLDR